VVIGTVAGDIHDIGKNIVSLLLQVSGFDVSDLGSDVQSMKFLEGAERFNADVIGLSALMSTTRTSQKEFLDLLEGLKKRVNYQVIVGGGATTKEWSQDIGADGYAEDAVQAPKLVTKLIANRKTIKA
jgi:methanogenic corrinoid protein MtbC1